MKKIIQIIRSRSILAQMFFALLTLLAVALLGIIMLFHKIYTEHYIENHLMACARTMEHTESVLSDEIDEIQNALTDFFSYKNVNNFIVRGDNYESQAIVDTAQTIFQLTQRSDWIKESYLYVYDGNHVLDYTQNLKEWSDFKYQKEYQECKAWRVRTIEDIKNKDYYYTLSAENGLFLFQDYPTTRSLSTVIVLMDLEKVVSTAKNEMGDVFCDSLFIFDKEWNMILPSGENSIPTNWEMRNVVNDGNVLIGNMEVEQRDVKALFLESEETGWKYLCLLEDDEIIPTSVNMVRRILPITLMVILLFLLFAIWLIQRFYGPIRQMVQVISLQEEKNLKRSSGKMINEFEQLRYFHKTMQDKNGKLQNTLTQVATAVTEKNLKDYLENSITAEHLFEVFRDIGSPWKDFARYGVLCVKSYNWLESERDEFNRELDNITLKNVMNSYWKGKCLIWLLPMKEEEYAIILRYPEEESISQIKRDILLFEEQLMELAVKNNMKISVGYGGISETVDSIRASWQEARVNGKKKWYYYKSKDSQTAEQELLYYEKQIEMYLKEIAKGVEPETNIIDDSMEGLSEEIKPLVLLRWLDLLAERLIALPFSEERNQYLHHKIELEENIKRGCQERNEVISFAEKCCGLLKKYAQKEQMHHMEKARAYIAEKYMDSSLSLDSLGGYLGLSASYLSNLFVEYQSPGFVDYLGKVRIEHAKELLTITGMSVSEIGYRTGFNSVQNFIRVFKKYSGMTPGRYREMQKEEGKIQ